MIREIIGNISILSLTSNHFYLIFDHQIAVIFYRPLTLPNFLNIKRPKKPVKYNKYGESKSPYVHSSEYGSYNYHGRPSPVHDFTPMRGNSGGGGSTGYSFTIGGGESGVELPVKDFDDYNDNGGRHYSPYTRPKSFVSVSSNNANEDESDGVINIDHSRGYDPAGDNHYYDESANGPSRDYQYSDDNDVHTKYRREYQTDDLPVAKSPYFYHQYRSDYNEPSSTSMVQSTHYDDTKTPQKKKSAYWRMSYVQNV